MWYPRYLNRTPFNRILTAWSAPTIHAYLVLCFPILRLVSRRLFIAGFTRHCCWHRNFQLFTGVFHGTFWILHHLVQWKKIPRNLLALSGFGFSMIHFCFALRFDASDICFHISGHTLSGLEVVCFLVNLLSDHVYPSGGLSFNKMNLVKPVHASDNSLSPSTFQ